MASAASTAGANLLTPTLMRHPQRKCEMKRLRLSAGLATALAAATVVLVVGSVGASASSVPSVQHHTFSNNWQSDTGVAFNTSVVDVCPLFPGPPNPTYFPSYWFSNANLTDQIKSTWIPYLPSGGLQYRFKSVGTVAGVIYASDGTYTVTTSGRLIEDRIGEPSDSWYFLGSGRVTITGPGGTMSGKAWFQDGPADNAAESFLFTSITSCQLN
jgi:hypothetical protein